jgi:glutamine synthetase
MNTNAPLSLAQLSAKVKHGEVETIITGFVDHYGRLLGKRFDADFFLDSAVKDGTHCCDYLMTTDMEMEPVQGFKTANWELGYGDFHLIPDLNTLRLLTWQNKTAMVFCDIVNAEVPRTMLKTQITKLQELGLGCKAASELEHYLFESSYREAQEKKYNDLKPAGWYLEDYHIFQGTRTESFNAAVRSALKSSGIKVETSKGEWGKGQHEINIKYAEVLQMADQHIVFKQCLKEVAETQGLSVSFMAKFHEDQAGSSCHIHLSLWNEEGNAFVGNNTLGPIQCSDTFKWFLGGWIKYVPDVMPFYAPTINSYKRYVDGSWAPTRLAWSHDNRTAGFRVVGNGAGLRIECRIPGADCNPYLAFSAALASGMKGIKDKIEPPEIFVGDIYAAKNLPRVPYSLQEANEGFKNSEFAREAFGNEVVDHYSHHFDSEVKAYQSAVSDWERKRYFERI